MDSELRKLTIDITPELAQELIDYQLEKKGRKPKQKIAKSIKITTTTDKDGNIISRSHKIYYR